MSGVANRLLVDVGIHNIGVDICVEIQQRHRYAACEWRWLTHVVARHTHSSAICPNHILAKTGVIRATACMIYDKAIVVKLSLQHVCSKFGGNEWSNLPLCVPDDVKKTTNFNYDALLL